VQHNLDGDMSELEKSKRDEKGLTLGHRVLLRIVVEFNRALNATMRIGDPPNLREVMDNPIILDRVFQAVTFGLMLGKKLGTFKEVEEYLRKYDDEDSQFLREEQSSTIQSMLETTATNLAHDILMQGTDCETCGEKTCLSCKTCHSCEQKKEVQNLN
jgi:hypothetical protein